MGVAVSREPQQELFLGLLQEGHSDLCILVAGRGRSGVGQEWGGVGWGRSRVGVRQEWGGGGAGRE